MQDLHRIVSRLKFVLATGTIFGSRLTGFCLVLLLGLLDAPTGHLNVLADIVVARLFFLRLLQSLAVFMPPILDASRDELLNVADDPVLNLS